MAELVHTAASPASHPARSLLDRLRLETRPIHERLERDLNLLHATVSLSGYRDTVARFYGIYRPLEHSLFPGLQERFPDTFCSRRKVPALLADLNALEVAPASVDLCHRLPHLVNIPHLLGACYVMEGATLGGQVISRHLACTLGIGPENGGAFFHGYASRTGSMWANFRACLVHNSSPENDILIVEGALLTFEAMHHWLCGRGRNG